VGKCATRLTLLLAQGCITFFANTQGKKNTKTNISLSRGEGIKKQVLSGKYWLEENILQPAKRQVMRFAVGKVCASFHFACGRFSQKNLHPSGSICFAKNLAFLTHAACWLPIAGSLSLFAAIGFFQITN